MWCRKPAAKLIFFLSCTFALWGCSSTTNGVEDEEITQPLAMTTADAYEAASHWLPAEPGMVITAVGPTLWDHLSEEVLPVATSNTEPGDPGTLEGLRADYQKMAVDAFGFDVGQAHALVVGANMQGGLAVLFGNFDVDSELPTVDVGDRMAIEVDVKLDAGYLEPELTIYVLPIDDPHPGLVMAMTPDDLEGMVDETTESLARADHGTGYSRLFAQSEHATVTVASPVIDLPAVAGAELPLPEWAMLRYAADGDIITALVKGDDASLDELQGWMDQGTASLQHLSDEIEADASDDFFEDLFRLFATHNIASVLDQLQPVRDQGELSYELELATDGLVAIWTMSSLLISPLILGTDLWDSGDDPDAGFPPLEGEASDEVIEMDTEAVVEPESAKEDSATDPNEDSAQQEE